MARGKFGSKSRNTVFLLRDFISLSLLSVSREWLHSLCHQAEGDMQTGDLYTKMVLHKKAAKRFEKAYRLHRDAMRALFDAEEIERQIEEEGKVPTIIRKSRG
jgi:hypothetical protein